MEVSGSKRHGVLAMLALRPGHIVGVDTLVDALWGEDLPSAPRNALQHHVMRIRAALGRDSIVAAPDGYALAGAAVDALRFEELLGETRVALRERDVDTAADSISSALALWRGPALHGLTDSAWFSAEAARLEALRVDALEEQFEVALARGEHREVATPLRATLEENPFRERLWGQLMLSLYRSGRQADALETFQEARRVLSDELGLEPGPELRRLQEAILAQDPAIAPVPSPPIRHGKLPTPSTSFVGRDEDVARVAGLLHEHRLVTLTGPPGVGKSRLALETARTLESGLTDGVWFVDLGRATDAADVVRLVAGAVDARGADPLARTTARLGDRAALVILDTCEHVVDEARRVTSALLSECSNVRVLATSREVLRLPAEARLQVEPLGLADGGVDSPALQLFLARARTAQPGFDLTPEAAEVVAEIARRLDGLPLGIELAAARVDVLGLTELLSVVERRLDLLRDRPPSDDARTALSTLVQWSYDVLHADEKTLLHHLAVHRGGASLASLAAGGADHGLDDATVTYLVEALADKSIVSVSFPAGDARYDLLDTVRDYVIDRLRESGGLAAARKAHAEYFAALAAAAGAGTRGREWQAWTRRLDLENDNLWAALAYARETPDHALATRLGAPLGWYFALDERVSEGRRFVELALEASPDDAPVELLTEALAFLCYLASEELDFGAAIEAGEQALALAARGEARLQLATAKTALALAVARSGDAERSAALVEEAHTEFEAAGDDWGVAASSIVRAQAAVLAGDVTTVATMTDAALRHAERIGYDAFRVPAILLQAWVAEQREDVAGVADAYGRAVDLATSVGFDDHAAFALARLGSRALADGVQLYAEELERRALAAAEAASADWVAAYARVELGRVLAAGGDAEAAEQLYRSALAWSEVPRPRSARESLFIGIAGTPSAGALLGLAELAEASGDGTAAADLRGRAQLTAG